MRKFVAAVTAGASVRPERSSRAARMERGGGDGGHESDGSSPQHHHNTIWKQLQARAKPLLSPKLGSREPEDKKERGGWVFKKMRRKEHVVLDRIISSSQPDLLFSQADLEAKEARLCVKAAGGKLAPPPSSSPKQQSASPDKPTLAQLVQSHHHKSSSLGSACLDRLAEAPGAEAGTAAAPAAAAPLDTSDEQPVSRPATCPR